MSRTLTDAFQEHLGAKEYDEFVTKMIRWYYGGFAKVAWCAISMSYMANELGILDQIGGKNQNCFEMLTSIQKAIPQTHKGTLKLKEDLRKGDTIKRGSIVFILRSEPPMTVSSKKHVTTAYEDFEYTGKGSFSSLGGNQSDYIKIKDYGQSLIYAVFEPEYDKDGPQKSHKTLRKGDAGAEVKEMQEALKKLGFGCITGHTLAARGNFKNNTYNTVKKFQSITGCCKPDGICGPLTWAMIESLLSQPKVTRSASTNVWYRRGPGLTYKKLGITKKGKTRTFTTSVNGWGYMPEYGWSKLKYF